MDKTLIFMIDDIYEQDPENRYGEFTYNNYTHVTHDTKKAVMKRISKKDLNGVGCNNPDIYVEDNKSIDEARIVLTRSKTYRKNKGKSKKWITNIKAIDIFGEEWPKKLNTLRFQTLGDILKKNKPLLAILERENTDVVFVDIYHNVIFVRICSNSALK